MEKYKRIFENYNLKEGKLFTIYFVIISGNRQFPKNGSLFVVNANNAEQALIEAEQMDENMDIDSDIDLIKDGNIWRQEELDDISLTVVAQGQQDEKTMVKFVKNIWKKYV